MPFQSEVTRRFGGSDMISGSPLAFVHVAKGGGADRVGEEEDHCCLVTVREWGDSPSEKMGLEAPSLAGSL